MSSNFNSESMSLGINHRDCGCGRDRDKDRDRDRDRESEFEREMCCRGETGCEWDGTLRRVRNEPIFVQKVFDATLVNLQALSTVNNVKFRPDLGRGARIVRVLDIRCRRFFNPKNINDPKNLIVDPDTILSGGQFVKDERGKPVEVVGPDGLKSEKIIFADTSECDDTGRGTPVFGTQRVRIRGNVLVEIDVVAQTSNGRRRTVTLTANVPITPVELTNFFELCIPSVFNSAFFPRLAEFCSVLCETRLATNSITRDIEISPETGQVRIDLIIAICISCEKKIIVPVQLCVLSTGFPQLSPEISPICTTFPTLFPEQIDENKDKPPCPRPRPRLSLEAEDFVDEDIKED